MSFTDVRPEGVQSAVRALIALPLFTTGLVPALARAVHFDMSTLNPTSYNLFNTFGMLACISLLISGIFHALWNSELRRPRRRARRSAPVRTLAPVSTPGRPAAIADPSQERIEDLVVRRSAGLRSLTDAEVRMIYLGPAFLILPLVLLAR